MRMRMRTALGFAAAVAAIAMVMAMASARRRRPVRPGSAVKCRGRLPGRAAAAGPAESDGCSSSWT